jgi:hypothetical protein
LEWKKATEMITAIAQSMAIAPSRRPRRATDLAPLSGRPSRLPGQEPPAPDALAAEGAFDVAMGRFYGWYLVVTCTKQ